MLSRFLLSFINSLLVGILVILNLHMLRNLRLRISKSALSGTTLSIISTACAGCTTPGLTLASTFGAVGIVASNLLLNNQILIREISTAILFLHFVVVILKTEILVNYLIEVKYKTNQTSHHSKVILDYLFLFL